MEIQGKFGVIFPDVTIGEGTRLGNFVMIRGKTVIGEHCTIGSYADIEGDVVIGDHVSLQSGCYLIGGGRLGRHQGCARWCDRGRQSRSHHGNGAARGDPLSGEVVGLRVLITNLELWPPSGTVTYVRDLALELRRQGHTPVLFTSTRGSVADGLRATGIVVSDRLSGLEEPDIIHGHHPAPTLIAVKRWPAIPAIHVCPDHLSPLHRTPLHPRIRRHVGVSRLCLKRLLDEGVSKERVALLPNFVDTERF